MVRLCHPFSPTAGVARNSLIYQSASQRTFLCLQFEPFSVCCRAVPLSTKPKVERLIMMCVLCHYKQEKLKKTHCICNLQKYYVVCQMTDMMEKTRLECYFVFYTFVKMSSLCGCCNPTYVPCVFMDQNIPTWIRFLLHFSISTV